MRRARPWADRGAGLNLPPSHRLLVNNKTNNLTTGTQHYFKIQSGQPKDYHKSLNCDDFVKWVQLTLIPQFKDPFGPETAIILVLDNCKAHK